MSQMIIITGIGRCGTSFVTKVFKESGYRIGSDKWFKKINAGLENRHTLDINVRLLRYYVKGEKINLHHVRGDIAELNFDAVKDTQFLAHPMVIKEWFDVRDDLEVLWMKRDHNEIVESMKRHPGWNTPVYRLFPEMIKAKEQAFEQILEEIEIEYHTAYWPQLLDSHSIFCNNYGIDEQTFKNLVKK